MVQAHKSDDSRITEIKTPQKYTMPIVTFNFQINRLLMGFQFNDSEEWTSKIYCVCVCVFSVGW